jgi:hypothetical protein
MTATHAGWCVTEPSGRSGAEIVEHVLGNVEADGFEGE